MSAWMYACMHLCRTSVAYAVQCKCYDYVMLRNDVTYGPTAAIFYRPEVKHLCYNCLQSIIGRDTEVVLRIPAQ